MGQNTKPSITLMPSRLITSIHMQHIVTNSKQVLYYHISALVYTRTHMSKNILNLSNRDIMQNTQNEQQLTYSDHDSRKGLGFGPGHHPHFQSIITNDP